MTGAGGKGGEFGDLALALLVGGGDPCMDGGVLSQLNLP